MDDLLFTPTPVQNQAGMLLISIMEFRGGVGAFLWAQ
jgi:hypothetical protein